MTKMLTLILIAVLFTASAAVPYAMAANDDTVIDKVGDWFAVLGKPEDEKDMILAKRRSKRVVERMQKAAEEGMKEFNNNMKKAFGK